MFLKSAMIYRFTKPVEFNRDQLIEALASKPHREPGAQELSTYGFIPPFDLGEQSPLVQTAVGVKYTADLIAAKKTERMLPGSVVRDALKKKVDAIESEQLRKVYKKERDQLKDDIVQALLPHAFLRHKVTFALIFDDMIIVDASSAKHAEDLLSTLRDCLGSLPVRPVSVKLAPSATMTSWVQLQAASNGLALLDSVELHDTHEEGGSVRVTRQDLTGEEVQQHLASGKIVTKLALAWEDKLSFVLDDKLQIKRLRWEDLLQDQAMEDGGEDAQGQLIASLTIAAGTLANFIPALIDALGGEEVPSGI